MTKRLDANESVWLERELESVDQKVLSVVYPQHKARMLIPTETGGPSDFSNTYVWKLFEDIGRAGVITEASDDIPAADRVVSKGTLNIVTLASSFRYSLDEIRASRATGLSLDQAKAGAARFQVENELDRILALGDTKYGLKGILNLTGTTTATSAGAWSAATADTIYNEVTGLVEDVIEAMGAAGAPFTSLTLALPIPEMSILAHKRMGTSSDITILGMLQRSPYIASITEWQRCSEGTKRLLAFPSSPNVVSSVVPQELQSTAPQPENLSVKVIMTAKTGGIVARYPKSIGYLNLS